jgi:hypothetical protein
MKVDETTWLRCSNGVRQETCTNPPDDDGTTPSLSSHSLYVHRTNQNKLQKQMNSVRVHLVA